MLNRHTTSQSNDQRLPSRRRGALLRIGLTLIALLLVSAVATSLASAAVPKALINESTVSGGALSQEAVIAEKAGLEVTVVSDGTWEGMTAAEFGQYQVLIAGDPTCGSLPEGLIKSASVYGSVVLGLAGGRTTAGNRVLVGTDPVFHDFGDFESKGARGTIIRQGITFAAEKAGTTGMYFDSTCGANYFGQSAATLEILEGLSASGPAWTIDAEPPCGGNVSLIAANPAFNEVTTESLQGWGCSVHESFPTFSSEWSALAVATDTESHPTCGVDPNTKEEACGEAYILIAGSKTVVTSESIEISPLEAKNEVGTNHTVTAHVTEGKEKTPVVGQVVTFTVTGVNGGASGTCVPASCATDASGNVTFTYNGKNVGEDTIKASFTDKKGSLQSATATKEWFEKSGGNTCTKARGVGHLGPRGPEGFNENNDLNVSGKPHNFEFKEPGVKGKLTKLASSSCTGPVGEQTFAGKGPGKFNGEAVEISFSIGIKGGKIYYTVVVEKESKVIYSRTNEVLNKTSKEKIS